MLTHLLASHLLSHSLSPTPHSLLTAYQDAGGKAAHKGPKKTAFGVPEGFYPDKESGMYFNEASGYY